MEADLTSSTSSESADIATLSASVDVDDERLLALYPGRGISRDDAAIYRGWLRRELLVNRCGDCGIWHQPASSICPSCWSVNVVPTAVKGDGTNFMFVLLHQGPAAEGVDYAVPYPVVIVELDEQPCLRITATVIGSPNEKIAIGRRVHLDWFVRGGAPLPGFRLVEEDGQ